MGMWPSQWITIKAIVKIARKKFFGASTGFEPVASALALQCSPSWAMKTHTLEAGQFIEFINPWKETLNEMMWTAGIQMKWICDHRSESQFHSVFHFFHGLMNSINWPASSVWVFIAQLGEHCSANAEATGSNPVEAPKNFFSGYFRNCLNFDSLGWSHTHFICIPAVHIISFSDSVNSLPYMNVTQ